MDNYFTSFCLLSHLEVNNIRARGVLKNNSLYKYIIIGDKQLQKEKRGQFEQSSARLAKTVCNLCGWLEQQHDWYLNEKHRSGIWMKKWWWYPFAWMVDVVLQGVRVLHSIN